MDGNVYSAAVDVAFRGAAVSVGVLRDSLHYAKDAERLVLNLELERFRLHIWGENCGLVPADDKQETVLHPRLVPIGAVLGCMLDEIRHLMQDADKLAERYGLCETDQDATKSQQIEALVQKMAASVKATTTKHNGKRDLVISEAKTKTASPTKRLRWAIQDVKKFNGLVVDLANRINKLNQLLTESQQAKLQQDQERISIVMVENIKDMSSLELLLAAAKSSKSNDIGSSATQTRIENKSLSLEVNLPVIPQPLPPPPAFSQYTLPADYQNKKRFIATKDNQPYLFEAKTFDPHISPEIKKLLNARLQRLVMLLSKPKTAGFYTPEAVGCIHDPSSSCWWMVFRLRGSTASSTAVSTEDEKVPVSLHDLLTKSKLKPALEDRYRLASRLCSTLFELYSSSWLHKGVRSANVLFDSAISTSINQKSTVLDSLILCGFDFARQESEMSSVTTAASSKDVEAAMYRHPRYQGTEQRYRIEYDMYSLGLVLVEIALWVPLSSFLLATNNKNRVDSPDRRLLRSPAMDVFGEEQAKTLRKHVFRRLESEFAFRVGTAYMEATRFCLEFGEREVGEEERHPALEFYNCVVVPLSRLAEVKS
ncbi:hypothetical protein VHEMI02820 [[Torrubiella] hemipterigena]|uniref:Protein kinase domain-containing protein n=1 Tax=[Torrubiella] hemipterigena TaxID=1531966 RepID=A0A0A1T918_9HYPO|nr:hypothetical protein VHEMI02820 [[Torrubiella] hemipterigena]